jgi:hypothetical protein
VIPARRAVLPVKSFDTNCQREYRAKIDVSTHIAPLVRPVSRFGYCLAISNENTSNRDLCSLQRLLSLVRWNTSYGIQDNMIIRMDRYMVHSNEIMR